MTLGLIDEAVSAGARLEKACDVLGLSERTVERWRHEEGGGRDGRAGPHRAPPHELSAAEKAKVLEVAGSPEFRDMSPRQIVPTLADRGEYVASESSFYRVLKEAGQAAHRGRARRPSASRPKELVAEAPNRVWCWDITYLRSSVRGVFYMIGAAIRREGVPEDTLVLHADNGGPMKGSTMLATLQRLGIVPSFSRPSVSDDNAFIEALFRTMKYRPGYPRKPFASVEAARRWVDTFVAWYNDEHLHSGIRYVTPSDCHAGRDVDILANRREVYARARKRTPRRWTCQTRNWTPVGPVPLNRLHPDVGRRDVH